MPYWKRVNHEIVPANMLQSNSLTQSKWVCQQVSLLAGFLRETCATSADLCLTQPVSPGFHSEKLWGLLFLALEPWAGDPYVGLEPLASLGEPLQPRYLLIFN